MPDRVFPRVDEIAPYLPAEAVLAVELAVARWENVQLRAHIAQTAEAVEEGGG